jgi:ribosome-binding protein aMBF1 (putative translation factor)
MRDIDILEKINRKSKSVLQMTLTTADEKLCKINRKSAKSETNLSTLFAGGIRDMPKPKTSTGEKNLISQRLIELRRQHNMSQRLLAYQLQLNGYDMDKNVITRIETNKRYVTDVELKALTEIFHVSYEYLIEGKEEKS